VIAARWIDRNTIEAPASIREPGMVGDGADRITPSDPRWARWVAWLERHGSPRPKS